MAELDALDGPEIRTRHLQAPGTLQTSPAPGRYARFLVRFPYIPPLLVVSLVAMGAGLSVHFYPLPTFQNPTEGFGTYGTVIAGRSKSLQLLHGAARKGLKYTYIPDRQLVDTQWEAERQKRETGEHHPAWKPSRVHGNCSTHIKDTKTIKFVFESRNKESLFTVESIMAMCELEEKILAPYVRKKWHFSSEEYCPMLSLPYFMSKLYGKPCHQLQQREVDKMNSLLSRCAYYYEKKTLQDSCTPISCPLVPEECMEYAAAYNILHYLTDKAFFQPPSRGNFLKYTLFIYSVHQIPGSWLDFYKQVFQEGDPSNELVIISGASANASLKYEVFNECLSSDIKFFGLALGLVLLVMLVYLRSLVLMMATVLNVIFSFILAYAFYVLILRITFFPFLNILAVLILIAVAADDVFIFHDALEQAKSTNPDAPLDVALTSALNHAVLSIFVTSFTTSAAFYANYISNIVALKCFGLFTGTAVLANFLLMVTWTPSVIVAVEKCCNSCCAKINKMTMIKNLMVNMSNFMCGRIVSPAVIGYWFLWVPILFVLGSASVVVIMYKPGLKLPQSPEIQLMQISNPLENWDQKQKFQFRYIADQIEQLREKIYMSFVWGLHDEDNGKWFDIHDNGDLSQVHTFDSLTPEAQLWTLQFCQHIKKQDFVDESFRTTPCLIELLNITNIPCDSISDNITRECCSLQFETFPFDKKLLRKCLPVFVLSAVALKGMFPKTIDKYIFDKNNFPAFYEITIKSSRRITTTFKSMENTFSEMDTFMKTELTSAPPGMREGWVTGYYKYYFQLFDLQLAIFQGTYYSVALSLGVASIVMVVTSLNLLLTLYAMLTISLAIAATIACIVLLGWELNVIESLTISLAVGLSIDFTIHYGVAYRISRLEKPLARVHEATLRVGSAVAMAALTTFCAGAAIMPCCISGFTKLGTFLMLVMAWSWVFATFFFQGLCRVLGPRGRCCQVPTSCSCCRHRRGAYRVQQIQRSTIITTSHLSSL